MRICVCMSLQSFRSGCKRRYNDFINAFITTCVYYFYHILCYFLFRALRFRYIVRPNVYADCVWTCPF